MEFLNMLTQPQTVFVTVIIVLSMIILLALYSAWQLLNSFDGIKETIQEIKDRPPEIVTVAPQLDHYTLRTMNIPGVGTYGTLTGIFGEFICRTVEREWLNNNQSISCVPAGMYNLVYFDSPKYGMRYHLENPNLGVTVAGDSQRTHCLFHAANEATEVQGCIAPGLQYMSEKWGVYPSGDALKILESDLIKTGVTKLEIIRIT